MAVLEDIRKKGGIIISIVIGLALFAFIIGDFVPGGRGARNFDVAKVAGRTLTVHELEAKIEDVTNEYRQQTGQTGMDDRLRDMIHDRAWQLLISETIMQREYELIGLMITDAELWDILTGPNPNPRIRQYFTDPQTGEFDRSGLMNFLRNKNSDPMAVEQWNMLEKTFLDERYMEKYSVLVGKGIYVPDFMAENENQELNRKVDFDFITQRYTSIPDSLVKVSSDEMKAYYNKNKKRWEQTASRDIEFVVFDIVASDEDRAAAREWIENIKPEFEQAPDPLQFVRLNSRVSPDTRFLTREQLPVQAVELFDEPVGSIAGPYQEGEAWNLVRLVQAENRPDSVKVRQIVILPKQQTQASYREAVALADSVKTAIETPCPTCGLVHQDAEFRRLAVKYSADPEVAANHGELGWIYESDLQGSMMENLFTIKRNEVTVIESGQAIFVVQVTERGRETKKVQIATLQHNILPSSRTEQTLWAQASRFAVENRTEERFNATVAAQNLNRRLASYIGENDRQLPGLPAARQIVRWAYEAKRGQVSDVFTVDNSFVVAVLKDVRKKGFAPVNQVAAEIDMNLRREKKAALIASQLSEAVRSAQSFSELAVDLLLPVESATAITFSSFSVPGAGIEPQLIATATSKSEGVISQPVEGINGVFLLTVRQIVEADESGVEPARERLSITIANRSMSESAQALRKAAKIEDWRSKFY